MLRNIADHWMVVPLGERVINFNGLITLSETGAFLWDKLQQESNIDDLLQSLLEDYDVDKDTAYCDIEEFINSLRSGGVLEE